MEETQHPYELTAIIDWEGVIRAFLNTSEVRYHDRPFYGSHYACPACSMGRPCPFRDAIRLAEAAVENGS